MLRRSISWAVAVLLLLASGAVLVLQAEVDGFSGPVSCGSGLDAITGRTTWEDWWAQDLADPSAAASPRLIRSEDCAGAVNTRVVVAAFLAGAAALAAIGGLAAKEGRGFEPSPETDTPAHQLARLGSVLGGVGVALTIGGMVAVVALVADPESTLFLYVDRLVVTLIGAIVLVPALALVFAGRAVALIGRHLERSHRSDAAP